MVWVEGLLVFEDSVDEVEEFSVVLFGDVWSLAHGGAGFKEDAIESGIGGQLSR